MRPGPCRADHAQRPVPRDGDRVPQGAHGPGERQLQLHATRDRTNCSTTSSRGPSSTTARWARSSPTCCRRQRRSARLGGRRQRAPSCRARCTLEDALAQGDTGSAHHRVAGRRDDVLHGRHHGQAQGRVVAAERYLRVVDGRAPTTSRPHEIHDRVRAGGRALVRGVAADARRRDVDRVLGHPARSDRSSSTTTGRKFDARVGMGNRRAGEGRPDDDGRRRLRRTAGRGAAAR